MELREQAKFQTLARRIGDIPHVSSWLEKISESVGLENEKLQDWLLKSAVERGADHYAREFAPELPPDDKELCNEELAIALCHPSLPYSPICIRAAAQLLSAPDTNLKRLLRLAEMERVEAILNYIAERAEQVAPVEEPWASLRKVLKPRLRISSDGLPHWSRFVLQTGMTGAHEGGNIVWLRRLEEN